MDLLSALAHVPIPTPRAKILRCGFARWLETLPPVEQDSVVVALENPEWANPALFRILQSEAAYPYQITTLKNHRTGVCCCVA